MRSSQDPPPAGCARAPTRPTTAGLPGVAARPGSPVRTCIGCGLRTDPSELVRLRLVDGRVIVDGARSGGRGAWLHRSHACLERAARRRAFGRAFRAQGVQADARALREVLTGNARKD